MDWGSVELEPEVTAWLAGLTDEEFGQAAFYIDLLAERGVHLSLPYTKQLKGKLAGAPLLHRPPTVARHVVHCPGAPDHPAHRLPQDATAGAARSGPRGASDEDLPG